MAETSAGRKVFQDENGENYSEKTITFETEYGWINMPTVDADGNEMTQQELEEFVAENGPIDPVTGFELSVFEDLDSALESAQRQTDALAAEMALTEEDRVRIQENIKLMAPERTENQRDNNSKFMNPLPQGMYHGGMPCSECGGEGCGCGGDGMMVGIDPVSGNPVPPGSGIMNVRDDIPAVLSDGEYVVPADVVRYHGLKTFMALRDEAKMGLMMMQAEGQIKDLDEEQEEYETVDCPTCDGTGEIDGEPCEHCEGYGYHYADELEQEESDSESSSDADVSSEESVAEEGEGEFQEEHETPEGNRVESTVTEVVEEFMEPDDVESEEEEDFYPTKEGQFAYKPTVRFAVMRVK